MSYIHTGKLYRIERKRTRAEAYRLWGIFQECLGYVRAHLAWARRFHLACAREYMCAIECFYFENIVERRKVLSPTHWKWKEKYNMGERSERSRKIEMKTCAPYNINENLRILSKHLWYFLSIQLLSLSLSLSFSFSI